MANPITLQGS